MKDFCIFSTLLLINILISVSNGYRILGVFPLSLRSHDLFCQSVMTALAKRGHQVDVIVTREIENPPENYTVISNIVDLVPRVLGDAKLEYLTSTYIQDPIKYVSHVFGNQLCELLANKKLREIIQKLKNGPKYDLFVIEAFADNCFMGWAHFLQIPIITLSAQTLYPWVEDAIGNPTSAAIHPTILSSLIEINSFWAGLQNTMEKIIMRRNFHYYTDALQTELMRKYIDPKMPNVRELPERSILTLINTHFSFNGIRPSTPALIEVGGLHILQDETEFTPEMQNWMDESKHGVVCFSLGTLILIDSLPKKTIMTFYSVIEKLKPVRFLMKMSTGAKSLPEAPENLKTLSWIPQIPVLKHKNTLAFITQCGLLSSFEALYFGVPVIGIPVLADQFLNVDKLIKMKMAIKLNLSNITEENLLEALTLVLENSSYRQSAKKASTLFRDRPMNAEDTAIFWIEYVIRNGEILKSRAANLHWTQNELLDVYGFIIFSTIFIFYLIIKVIKAIANLSLKKKTVRIKEKKN